MVLAAVIGAGACGGDARESARPADRATRRPAHVAAFYSAKSFATARRLVSELRPSPARGLIVPHHWVAGHLILSGLRDVAAGRRLRRIVLLAPNHIGAGGAPVSTSDWDWATPFGRVEADADAVRSLARAALVTVKPSVLTHEHAISGLMPALAEAVPGARVVPLAVRPGMRLAEARRLSEALSLLVDGSTAVVASVDFSHYLSTEKARARDTETLGALAALDSGAVLSYSNEHLDSAGSIATLIETMRRVGATRFELRANTNSATLVGRSPGGVTSYIYGLYQ